MAKRLLTDKLIDLQEIDEELRLIDGSECDYITPSGIVYKDYGNNKFYQKKNFKNKHNGYMYVTLTLSNVGQRQRRVHNILAKAYLPNPNNFSVVGHKNNIKDDNRLENLYWTTVQENTQKAYDDGLAKTDKGFDDSQSKNVCVFSMDYSLIGIIGSERLASAEFGVTVTTITNQCKHNVKTIPRCGYYFRYLEEFKEKGFVL